MPRQWHRSRPDSLRALIADLERSYPTLHVSVKDDDANVVIFGTLPIRDPDGAIIDRFEIELNLPPNYPAGLPAVRETGGRVPMTEDRHINQDGTGTACVMLPEERYRLWPVGSPLSRFLDGPVRNFFLGQLAREQGEPWPFGEWAHGEEGLYQFVQAELGISDRPSTYRFVETIAGRSLHYRSACPCLSGKRLGQCCRAKVGRLRHIIPPARASRLLNWLAMTPTPVELWMCAGSAASLPDSMSRHQRLMASASPLSFLCSGSAAQPAEDASCISSAPAESSDATGQHTEQDATTGFPAPESGASSIASSIAS